MTENFLYFHEYWYLDMIITERKNPQIISGIHSQNHFIVVRDICNCDQITLKLPILMLFFYFNLYIYLFSGLESQKIQCSPCESSRETDPYTETWMNEL